MRLVEDDDVVEALSPDGADHPFRERILPGRAWCRHNLLDVHDFEPGAGHCAVNTVPIPDHVSRCSVPGERFGDLLRHPGCGRLRGHSEVHDPPSLVVQHDEHEKKTQRGCRQDEEVHGRHAVGVVAQKRPPCLGRWLGRV